jgi:hypothetical protein
VLFSAALDSLIHAALDGSDHRGLRHSLRASLAWALEHGVAERRR